MANENELEEAFQWFSAMGRTPGDRLMTLKEVRLARHWSLSMVADTLGISKVTYLKWERLAEREGLSVRQLKRAAEALDAELVIYFKSKNKTFARDLWEKLLPFAMAYPPMKRWADNPRPKLLAHIVLEECLSHPEIRRRLGWASKNFGYWPRYLRWDRSRWPYTV